MHPIKKSLCILSLLCTYTLATADNNDNSPTLTDLSKPIMVEATQTELSIRLKSFATAGYQWFIKSYDANLLTPESQKYLPSPNKKLMGAPGVTEFKFHVNPSVHRAGHLSEIKLVSVRPWEATSPDTKETVVTWVSTAQ